MFVLDKQLLLFVLDKQLLLFNYLVLLRFDYIYVRMYRVSLLF